MDPAPGDGHPDALRYHSSVVCSRLRSPDERRLGCAVRQTVLKSNVIEVLARGGGWMSWAACFAFPLLLSLHGHRVHRVDSLASLQLYKASAQREPSLVTQRSLELVHPHPCLANTLLDKHRDTLRAAPPQPQLARPLSPHHVKHTIYRAGEARRGHICHGPQGALVHLHSALVARGKQVEHVARGRASRAFCLPTYYD